LHTARHLRNLTRLLLDVSGHALKYIHRLLALVALVTLIPLPLLTLVALPCRGGIPLLCAGRGVLLGH
jgi:hypothetical protein